MNHVVFFVSGGSTNRKPGSYLGSSLFQGPGHDIHGDLEFISVKVPQITSFFLTARENVPPTGWLLRGMPFLVDNPRHPNTS